MNYFSLLSYSTATLSKIDPDSATAVGLKTALTEKLTVSESILGSQSFAVFFYSVTVDEESLDTPAPITFITDG